MQNPRKFVVHCISRSIRGHSAIIFHKSHMNILQVWEGYSPCTKTNTPTYSKPIKSRKRKHQNWIPKAKLKNTIEENTLRTAEGVVGHAKKSEAIGFEYVEDVPILGEANPRIRLRWKLFQDAPSHCPCVPCDRAELGQHDCSSSHHGVENRHLCFGSSGLRVWGSESSLLRSRSKSHGAVWILIYCLFYIYLFILYLCFVVLLFC